MKTYYNYIYLDTRKPGDYHYDELDLYLPFEPFYVGKGKENRYLDHLTEAYDFKDRNDTKKNKFKCRKIRKIKKVTGGDPIIIKINYTDSEKESLENEVKMIKVIGRVNKKSGPLCNLTDGGNGGSIFDENYPLFKEINNKRIDNLIKYYRPKMEVIELIIKWYVEDGETVEEIRRKLETIHPSTQRTIRNILVENNINLRKYVPDNTIFVSEADIEIVKDLHVNHLKTKVEICQILNKSKTEIDKIFKKGCIKTIIYKRNKYKSGEHHSNYRIWTPQELSEILYLRKDENWGIVRLIRYYHTSQECLTRAFEVLGISDFKIKVKPKPNALTEEMQNEVRRIRKENGLTYKEISLQFNISEAYVSQILKRQSSY